MCRGVRNINSPMLDIIPIVFCLMLSGLVIGTFMAFFIPLLLVAADWWSRKVREFFRL